MYEKSRSWARNQIEASVSMEERVGSVWAIFFCFVVPELFMFFSVRRKFVSFERRRNRTDWNSWSWWHSKRSTLSVWPFSFIVEGSYAKKTQNLEQNVTWFFKNELYYLSVKDVTYKTLRENIKYFCKKIEVEVQILLFLYKYGTSNYK